MASASGMLCFSSNCNSNWTLRNGLGQIDISISCRRRRRSTRLCSSKSAVTVSCLTDNKIGLLEAAKHTVDSHIKSGMLVGLGSGQASKLAIQYLGRQLHSGAVKDIVGVATSVDSASEALKAGIPLYQLQNSSQLCTNFKYSTMIDFAFNDADVVEEGTVAAIIGRQRRLGEESIIEETTILRAAEKLVFMITGKQYKSGPDGSIPVLVKPLGWMDIAEEIEDLFIGDAEVWRRSSVGNADPLGGDFPLLTRDGHSVLDIIFTSPITNLAEVGRSLDQIDGIIAHGIIAKVPCTAVIVTDDGLRIVDNTTGYLKA